MKKIPQWVIPNMKSCALVTIARCTALHFPLALGIQATTMRIKSCDRVFGSDGEKSFICTEIIKG